MILDPIVVERFFKLFTDLNAKGIKVERAVFDEITHKAYLLFEHRMGNVQQMATLYKDVANKQKLEIEELKRRIAELEGNKIKAA